jgi:hypothetical protein
LNTHATFPFMRGQHSTLQNQTVFYDSVVLCFITWSSWSIDSIGCSKWKRTFSNSNVEDDILHQGKNFQTKLALGVIKDDLLLDSRIGWIHGVAGEIILTWRRN